MHDNLKTGYLCSDVGIPVLGFMGCSVHVREMVNALAGLGSDISIFSSHFQRAKEINFLIKL